jgi:hypothetical protein
MKLPIIILSGFMILGWFGFRPQPEQDTAVPGIQAGEVVLYFNGSNIAMSQIVFDPGFASNPVIVCSSLNETLPGLEVGCQSLDTGIGSIWAQIDDPRDNPLTVQWIATERTQ